MCVYIQEAEKFSRVLLLKVILICDVTQESMSFSFVQKNTAESDPFFSHILTCEVNLIEFLEVMAQMGRYIIFLSLKPPKINSDFILKSLKSNF